MTISGSKKQTGKPLSRKVVAGVIGGVFAILAVAWALAFHGPTRHVSAEQQIRESTNARQLMAQQEALQRQNGGPVGTK